MFCIKSGTGIASNVVATPDNRESHIQIPKAWNSSLSQVKVQEGSYQEQVFSVGSLILSARKYSKGYPYIHYDH